MNDASWPIFIAAPFIDPSASTIRSAASRCDLSSVSDASSFDRVRFRARVPAYFAPEAPITDPTLAVRLTLPVGMSPSLGMPGEVNPSLHSRVAMANDRPTLEVEERPE